MKRTPWVIGAAVVVATTAMVPVASYAMADPAPVPPIVLCPDGYQPAPQQPATGTLCVAVRGDNQGRLHVGARVDPLLCAHVVVGQGAKPEDVVRTLHCPRVVPTTPPATEPAQPPADGGTTPAEPAAPVATPVVLPPNTLPVTH